MNTSKKANDVKTANFCLLETEDSNNTIMIFIMKKRRLSEHPACSQNGTQDKISTRLKLQISSYIKYIHIFEVNLAPSHLDLITRTLLLYS